MNQLGLILGIPAASIFLFAALSSYKIAARLNILSSLLTFLASISLLQVRPATTPFFIFDDLNVYLIILTTFITLSTSIFSARYMAHEIDTGHLPERFARYYHAMFQGFLFAMLLAYSSNNIGVLWVAVEGATLATVLLIGLYRTPAALEASWKYFILCSAGIGLALFGTTLCYLAAEPVVGTGLPSLTWSVLQAHGADLSAPLLNIAFVFLLVGYGTKVGMAPLHAWLPDAHAEGPTPISALLSGLLLNVALYAVLRFKMVLTGNAHAFVAGPLMIFMGLASLLLAGFMLYLRKDIKRLFAYSSIEHMGIITFAFGIGGPIANFAGLLHMAMHSLTKSGIFFVVGQISQIKGTLKIADIRGLTASNPVVGWALVVGVLAIAGLPPSGIFVSEFLLVTSTFVRAPILAAILVIGLLIAFGALIAKLQGLAFGPAERSKEKASVAMLAPFFVQLGIVIAAGLYLPGALFGWLQNVAKILG